MKIRIKVTGADIDENPGIITRPDYGNTFIADVGEKSIDEVAQEQGALWWSDLHGESPNQIYYSWDFVE